MSSLPGWSGCQCFFVEMMYFMCLKLSALWHRPDAYGFAPAAPTPCGVRLRRSGAAMQGQSRARRPPVPARLRIGLATRRKVAFHQSMRLLPAWVFAWWVVVSVWSNGKELARPDWENLAELGKRHGMPFPDASARLALVHGESWTVVGNQSHPHDPAIYLPGWVLEEREGGSLRVLDGLSERVLEPRDQREPLWREFSLTDPPPRIGGHVARFDGVSTFVVAVQCAARGDRRRADALWERFAAADRLSDGSGVLRHREDKEDPTKLLASILFDRLELRIAEPAADFTAISGRMDALLKEFPVLADDRRKDLAARAAETANAKPPAEGSVEAMLIEWGKCGDDTPGRDDQGKMEAIVRRGFDAIPELLRLREDKRLTGIRYSAIMMRPSSPKPLGDLAQDVLAELLPDAAGLPAGYDSPVAGDFAKAWDKAQQKGERAYYLGLAWHRDPKGKVEFRSGALCVVGAKFPEELAGLVERYERETNNIPGCWGLAGAIADSGLPAARKTELLLALATKGSIACRRVATQVLAKVDHEAARQPARVLVRMLPRDVPGEYWTSAAAAVSHVVLAVDGDEVWRAFLGKARQAAVGLRLEWMNPFDYSYLDDRLKSRRLAFLAAFLDDKTLRDDRKNASKYEGPCAAFTFPKITVRDFVAMQIAAILKIDPFDSPDATWTAERWQQLRGKVARRLQEEGIAAMKP